ncbi:hypothetical protein LSM04_005581 [Trypanosoma melophagium]|uniref:uncharacterized protein n=1 Tax=Trypanosoma melophagium TaxID=715481 RepID=UPI003519F8F3|nr:hypothetical protein LSM04_000305 [Trypanosoma melophagium]KAH9600986.1 hypothetical protein LSM04_005581 [Trypanosoma melophagium]
MSSPGRHSSTPPAWHSMHGALQRLLSHTAALVQTLVGLGGLRPGVYCSRTGALNILGSGAALRLEEARWRAVQVAAVTTRTTAAVPLGELGRQRGAARRMLSECTAATEELMDKRQRPAHAMEWGDHTRW